jgi:hypothetical protein
MNAIRRICPPHIGHSSGNTSKILAINTAPGSAPVRPWVKPPCPHWPWSWSA